ncbi:MAG: putative metal-binding motif-containing protein, partial [Myxococcota bacterium]|nr:putative metal-binding motif-containing protein [Myxococcota bacterium]
MPSKLARRGTLAALALACCLATSCSSCSDPPGSSNTNNPPNNTTSNNTTPNNTSDGCRDLDGDGAKFGANCAEATDCDDQDGSVNPSAPEVCGDNRDNNCNGVT